MGAPMRRGDNPVWVTPCGPIHSEEHSSDLSESLPRHPYEVLSAIELQAKISLGKAQEVGKDWVRATFRSDLETQHKDTRSGYYEWSPRPKEPGMHVDVMPSPNKEALAKFYVDSYRYLQTIAVALEQVQQDMEARDEKKWSEAFLNLCYNLRAVLCEIHNAIGEQDPNHVISNVERNVMPNSVRVIENNEAIRNMRDWFIFRDYMNCLEYVIEVSEYFKSVIGRKSPQ